MKKMLSTTLSRLFGFRYIIKWESNDQQNSNETLLLYDSSKFYHNILKCSIESSEYFALKCSKPKPSQYGLLN